MTKKDYILIASCAKEVFNKYREIDPRSEALELFIIRLAEKLEADNPLFNREKFYKACGLS